MPQRAHLSRVSGPAGAGELSRITTIHPRTYNEAKTIGEHFRDGVPVIMNLSDMNDADAKRLVDFAAGLVFGLRGSIERVTSKVFLLSPEHVEVSGEDSETVARDRLQPELTFVRGVWEIVYLAVFIFLVLLIGRFILELVQSFARDWRPRGAILVVAEVIYTATDPPLKLLRRLIPPLRLGGISLDFGMLVLFIVTIVLLSILGSLAS